MSSDVLIKEGLEALMSDGLYSCAEAIADAHAAARAEIDRLRKVASRIEGERLAAHTEIARLREVATRIEGDRHAAASALIESDLAHGVYRVRMEAALAVMTTARDALADIADDLNGDNGDDEELARRRAQIASLRSIEKTARKDT